MKLPKKYVDNDIEAVNLELQAIRLENLLSFALTNLEALGSFTLNDIRAVEVCSRIINQIHVRRSTLKKVDWTDDKSVEELQAVFGDDGESTDHDVD